MVKEVVSIADEGGVKWCRVVLVVAMGGVGW